VCEAACLPRKDLYEAWEGDLHISLTNPFREGA